MTNTDIEGVVERIATGFHSCFPRVLNILNSTDERVFHDVVDRYILIHPSARLSLELLVDDPAHVHVASLVLQKATPHSVKKKEATGEERTYTLEGPVLFQPSHL